MAHRHNLDAPSAICGRAANFCLPISSQEENNNSLSSDQPLSEHNVYASHVLQNLSQNVQMSNLDASGDSLLALAVALRTTANASPTALHHQHYQHHQHQLQLQQHLSARAGGVGGGSGGGMDGSRFAAAVTNSALEKLLAPGMAADVDGLSIGSGAHRTHDSKGKLLACRMHRMRDPVTGGASPPPTPPPCFSPPLRSIFLHLLSPPHFGVDTG